MYITSILSFPHLFLCILLTHIGCSINVKDEKNRQGWRVGQKEGGREGGREEGGGKEGGEKEKERKRTGGREGRRVPFGDMLSSSLSSALT